MDNNYSRLPLEQLYIMARKKGIPHDDSLMREQLIEKLISYEEKEKEDSIPVENTSSVEAPFTAKEIYYYNYPIQELYEIARKMGVRHDDSMSKEELIEIITKFKEESKRETAELNPYSAKYHSV